MHLTLKKEATKPAAANFLQQQARFDKFIEVFNNQRPHQALDMTIPSSHHAPLPPNLDPHTLAVGVDRIQKSFEPMRKQVEAWQKGELPDVTPKVVIYEATVGIPGLRRVLIRDGPQAIEREAQRFERRSAVAGPDSTWSARTARA